MNNILFYVLPTIKGAAYISETVPLLSVSNICQTKQSAYRSTCFMMGPYFFQNKYMSVIQTTVMVWVVFSERLFIYVKDAGS
jgi:hypothetical protein